MAIVRYDVQDRVAYATLNRPEKWREVTGRRPSPMRMFWVRAAAAARVELISTLVPTMRSPQERLEKGPESTRRNHSNMVSRSMFGWV